MRYIILLLVCFSLLSFKSDKTGPSHCDFIITPIAFNTDGLILCKTFKETNEMGGHYQEAQTYGWLLVDSSGTWEEYVHADIPHEFTKVDYDIYDTVKKLSKEFYGEFDFENVPKSLDSIVGMDRMYAYYRDVNANQLHWVGGEIQNPKDSVLLSSQHQQSISGVSTINLEGTRVPCSSYFNGVAFFNNYSGFEDQISSHPIGGNFFHVDYDEGEYGYEIYKVTGVVIVK